MTPSAALGGALFLLLILTTWVFAKLARFRSSLPTLREWTGETLAEWPKVSVIVPCRNEASGVEAAMRSLLAQDYPSLEIVAIDDRSEDDTGPILERLSREDSRLTVVRIESLPPGWLGKNNAMREGAARAQGSWLLFTDGDVVFEPGALRLSVAFAERHGLGHFVALPHFVAHGFLERAFVSTFVVHFGAAIDAARLHVARSFAFVGVGAFGLVSRAAYERIGGHTKLAFEVADDVKLGLLLRRGGVAQGCLDSAGLVRVRWQPGFLATLRGLEKNAFAGFEWNTTLAGAAIFLLLAQNLLPYLALVAASSMWVQGAAWLVILQRALLVGFAARRVAGGSGLEGLAMPVTSLLFVGVIAWSVLLTLAQGGIRWRGSFYPLSLLRERCVRVLSFDRRTGVGWTPPAVSRS